MGIFYQGWKSKKLTDARDGATPDCLFPESRKSTLDLDVLMNLGLSVERVKGGIGETSDALFFLQLILPMCDPSQSGIVNDPRSPFYTEVEKFTNLYKHQAGIGSTYGHRIHEVAMPELVRWDGCIIRDGMRGGGDGALYRRWNSDSASFDPVIQEAMTLTRWNSIKRILKLNNNDTAKKNGEAGYNPAYKYDMIFDVIVKNVIAITKYGELNLTGDETSWGFGGFGEKNAKVVYRITKPGITKGGQTSIVSATNRIRPYWYHHRHAFTPRYSPDFTAEGPAEVRSCIDSLEGYVIGRDGDKKKIFKKCPHITFDNYFLGKQVFDYAGEKGFGLIMTNRRDRLPKGIKGEYMHKQRTDSNKRSKAARYIQPVVLVKEKPNYELVLTSFQSTPSCNIMSVNSMSENKNFIEARCRGRKNNKRHYVIEQNNARRLYLKSYSRIDSIDHLIKNCKINYCSWKYWHSAANHAKALAIVTSYDIYLELCEGLLDPSYKVANPVDFHTFRDILSSQMCNYDPTHQMYLGDDKTRFVSSLNKEMRQKRKVDDLVSCSDGSRVILFDQYKKLHNTKQICKDLTKLKSHHIVQHKSGAKCAVCGEIAFKRCTKCNVPLHDKDTRGKHKGKNCGLHWHNKAYLGLCFNDQRMICVPTKEWKESNQTQLKDNIRRIKGYASKVKMGL